MKKTHITDTESVFFIDVHTMIRSRGAEACDLPCLRSCLSLSLSTFYRGRGLLFYARCVKRLMTQSCVFVYLSLSSSYLVKTSSGRQPQAFGASWAHQPGSRRQEGGKHRRFLVVLFHPPSLYGAPACLSFVVRGVRLSLSLVGFNRVA